MQSATEVIDMQPRYVPETLIVDGRRASVQRYLIHPGGKHPNGCPLVAEYLAVECQTEFGSRWFGCSSAWINSELRMVVRGTNPRDEVRMQWKICRKD
jgi:hypothetical protein